MLAEYCVKNVSIRSYSGPYFPAFGLNTETRNADQNRPERKVFTQSSPRLMH